MRINLALLAEPLIAEQAKKRQGTRNDLNILDKCLESHSKSTNNADTEKKKNIVDKCPQCKEPNNQKKENRQNETNYKLAEMAGVSDKTIQRYKKIKQSAPKEIIQQVDSGELSINAGYNKVKQAERKQDIQRQVEQIE